MTPEAKERRREYYRIWAAANSAKTRTYAQRYRSRYPEKRLHHAAMGNARQKDLAFNLDVSDIFIPEVCPVFGTTFQQRTPFAASIDRIDSSKGYVKGNVQVISKLANTMKQNATREQLVAFAKWVLVNE